MRLTKVQLFGLFTFWCSAIAVAADFPLKPYDAQYQFFRSGSKLGKAQQSLSQQDNQWVLDYHSKASFLFLSDKRHETSHFSWSGQQLIPISYRYRRTGTGSDKALDIQFDSKAKTFSIDQEKTQTWAAELDNQLFYLDARIGLLEGKESFNYTLINYRGEQKSYGLKVLEKETLKLPYGELETVKCKLIRDNNRRETFIWFAPELQYQMVRIQQFKEGDEQGDIQLSQYHLLQLTTK